MDMKLLSISCLLVVVFVISASNQVGASALAARTKRSTLTEEAEKLIRQGTSIDINNVGQLIDLVEKNGADQCLTRVICELTQNGRAHGDAGVKFAQSLLKFRQSKHAKVKKYTDAMSTGAKAKNSEQCKTHYSRCTYSTQEVITVGNKILTRTR